MKLVQPTDFEILTFLSDGKRNVASNLAEELDRDRSYINTRLTHLEGYRLITRIGPAKNSGLYEITPRGRAVVQHKDKYDQDDVDFAALIRSELEGSCST